MFDSWTDVCWSSSGSTLQWSTLRTDTFVTRCTAPRSRPPHPSARRWWPSRTARGAATNQRFTSSHGTGRYTSKARPSCSPSTPGIHTAPRSTTTAAETQPGDGGLCPQSGWSPPKTPVHASFTQKTSERGLLSFPKCKKKTQKTSLESESTWTRLTKTLIQKGWQETLKKGNEKSVRAILLFCFRWHWFLIVGVRQSCVCVCGLYMCRMSVMYLCTSFLTDSYPIVPVRWREKHLGQNGFCCLLIHWLTWNLCPQNSKERSADLHGTQKNVI